MKHSGRILTTIVILLLAATVSTALADSDNSIAFGDVLVGSAAEVAYTFTLLETSETPAQVSISSPCPPFSLVGLESQHMILYPGESVDFHVRFAPLAATAYTCDFTITAAGGEPVQEIVRIISLAGNGISSTPQDDDPVPGLPSIFEFPWEEWLQTSETAVGTGTTQLGGAFEVTIPPATTVVGTLHECDGLPLEQIEIQVVPLDEGYGIAASGYTSIVADPVMEFSFFGAKSVDLGDICMDSQPESNHLIPIRLLSPLPGDGLTEGQVSVPLCWESLGIEGAVYQVIYHTKTCVDAVVNGPHPFAPMIPDPQLSQRASQLQRDKDRLNDQMAAQAQYCASLSALFDDIRDSLSEIDDHLGGLTEGRAQASAAQVGGLNLPLPSQCPTSAEAFLAPHAAALDGIQIQPCQPDPCRGLADALSAIIGAIQSLSAQAAVQSLEFERLLDRWVSGAEHRGTMELYHGIFSFVDGAISLVNDIIGILTPDIESLINDLVDEFLTDATCQRYPDMCESLRTAQSAREQLNTIRSIMQSARSTGTPGPAFIVQMVQAMAQQASAATAVAIAGWANFAEVMASYLWDTYESYLCLQNAYEWLLDREAEIRAQCEECLECLRNQIASIDAELDEIEVQEQAVTEARQAYWQEQLTLLSSQMGQVGAYLDDEWYDACCSTSPVSIEIPSEGLCAQQLEEALKQALGDKACFLEFSCTVNCEYENGVLVGASVECEHGFPLAERRTCCCVPCEREQNPVGMHPDPGQPGTPVCHPPQAGTSSDPGGWSIVALDESGKPIASSPRRPFGPGATTHPYYFPPVPMPTQCLCSISATLGGVQVMPGSPIITTQKGVPVAIAAVGDCGPPCPAGAQSISIQPPLAVPVWLPNPIGLIPLPISVPTANTTYDFPVEGIYTITVTQFCEDGQKCSTSFTVESTGTPGPVLRHPESPLDEPVSCPACGNDPCLELFYQTSEEPPLIPLFGHMLSVEQQTILNLELASSCRSDCEGDRIVRWEMRLPDGTLDALEEPGLYHNAYWLDQQGQYLLCIIETVPCEGRLLRFENWWIFEVEETP